MNVTNLRRALRARRFDRLLRRLHRHRQERARDSSAAERQQLHRGRQHRVDAGSPAAPTTLEQRAAHEADDQPPDLHHVEFRRPARTARRRARSFGSARARSSPTASSKRAAARASNADAGARLEGLLGARQRIVAGHARGRVGRRDDDESHGHRVPGADHDRRADLLPNGDNQTPVDPQQRRAAAYTFNTNNAIITDPGERERPRAAAEHVLLVRQRRGGGHRHRARRAPDAPVVLTVPDGYIGAVRSTADWTANWTYGFVDGRRGVAPWWTQ